MRFFIIYIAVFVVAAAVAKSQIADTPVKSSVVAGVELNEVTQECFGEGNELVCVGK